MGLLDRRRLDDDVVVMPPFAVIGKPALAGPRLADHRDRLVEARGRLLLRHAEAGEFIGPIALADAEIEPSVRQQIEGRRFFRDQRWVVPWQHDDGGAEADPLGARGEVAQQIERSGNLAEPGEVMLDQEHAGKPELLGGHHVFDEIVVTLAVAGRAAARPGAAEQSEFHAATPSLRLATIARGGSCQRHSTGANPASRSALRWVSTPSKNR